MDTLGLFLRSRRGISAAVSLGAFFSVTFVFPHVARSQVSTASMNGEVRDSSGAAVPGAKVKVTQTESRGGQHRDGLRIKRRRRH